jgi:hypothetical protein
MRKIIIIPLSDREKSPVLIINHYIVVVTVTLSNLLVYLWTAVSYHYTLYSRRHNYHIPSFV